MTEQRVDLSSQPNHDPLTGEAEFHPAGAAGGAVAGGVAGIGAAAAAGAAIGGIAGPIGLAAGAVVGAVAGGLAGKAIAERFDPTVEDEYWRGQHANQTYADPGLPYDAYRGAYRTGYEGRARFEGSSFEESEPALREDYELNRGESELSWEQSREAARASWLRMEDHFRPR